LHGNSILGATETIQCEASKLANKTVLFVCYGNICRSLMAEGFLRKMLSELNTKMQVVSAGLNAYGWSPTDEVIEIMKRQGVNITDHNSTQLTKELIEKAHLILTMEKSHKDAILWHYHNSSIRFSS
jgi:protein-tyrosine-phosphatase